MNTMSRRVSTAVLAISVLLMGLWATLPTPAHAAKPAAAPTPEARHYTFGRTPDWVKPVKPESSSERGASAPGYRLLLSDRQTLLEANGQQHNHEHFRLVAHETAALPAVSKAEIHFNPAFQTLTVHEASVQRNGVRMDRLKDARIELLRREEGLERQTLTGMRTLLVVMNDVRVGDVIEVAYTVHGVNPIFQGRFSDSYSLASHVHIDLVHVRVESPADRPLRVRGVPAEVTPERFTEGGRNVLRIQRRDVRPPVLEDGVPPWFKVYPEMHVSEYASWNEVGAWAEQLFQQPGELGPELNARLAAWRAKKLPRDQLAAEVLEMVQDEVRYFSASLGESSHRPKPPAQTYRERLGDCKDKVALLNALLRALGMDARPALVSMHRNRGINLYPPSHDQFDHVITRLDLDGDTHWLDPTMNKQGQRLQTRGTPRYGLALVVDARSSELTPVVTRPAALDGLVFEQTWDVAIPSRPIQMTALWRGNGLSAEALRASVAAQGAERFATQMASIYARVLPDIKTSVPPLVRDDRVANVFEIEVRFNAAGAGQYERGRLELDLFAVELLESLTDPRDARRETPLQLDQTRHVQMRVRVNAPRPFSGRPPAPTEVTDKHFQLSARYDLRDTQVTYSLNYQRRLDEVLPGDLTAYRNRLAAARALVSTNVRVPLIDTEGLIGEMRDAGKRVARRLGEQEDALSEMVLTQEMERVMANEALRTAGSNKALTAAVLQRRAMAHSMLNDAPSALADADAALNAAPDRAYSHYTRGLALLQLGRSADAVAAMKQYNGTGNRAFVDTALGTALYYQGDLAEAERVLKQVAQESGGEDRAFALTWLYITTQRQAGKGRAAIAPYLGDLDKSRWSDLLTLFVAGDVSEDELLQEARKDKSKTRLNLAEAYFYAGQRLQLAGDAAGARRMFNRTVEVRATPHREHSYAEIELKRSTER